MYYHNGRLAVDNDKAIKISSLKRVSISVKNLNGPFFTVKGNGEYVDTNDFLHIDDVKLALSGNVPNSSLTDAQLGVGLGLE